MANSPNTQPIVMDTDAASWNAIQTLQTARFGLRVWKVELVAASSTSAGTVTVTEPNSSIPLLPPIAVAATSAAGTIIYNDNPTQLLQWRDFAVTGLTATATKLFVWYRV